MNQKIVFSEDLKSDITLAVSQCECDKTFVLTDATTALKCWPRVKDYDVFRGAHLITIPAGDTNKNINSITHVWTELSTHGATRHSLLVNIGGGMVTDLGKHLQKGNRIH